MMRPFILGAALLLAAGCASSETERLREAPHSRGQGVEEKADNTLRNGDVVQATRKYELALREYRRLDDQQHIASVFLKLGEVMLLTGDAPGAADYFAQAALIAEREGFKELAGEAALSLASLAVWKGDLAGAEKQLAEAAAKGMTGWKPENVHGRLALAKGDAGAAKKRFERALDAARSGKNTGAQSACLANLGTALLNGGEPDKAIAALKQALEIDKVNAGAPAIADTLHLLGKAYEAKREYDTAEYFYRRALSINLLGGVERRSAADSAALARVASLKKTAPSAPRK